MPTFPDHSLEPDTPPPKGGAARALLIWGLLALVVVAVGYAVYDAQRDQLLGERRDQLWRAVTQKTADIEAWRDERVADALMATRQPGFVPALNKLLAPGADTSAAASLRAALDNFLHSGRYESAFILDRQGRLRLSVGRAPGNRARLAPLAAQTLSQDQPVLDDFRIVTEGAQSVRFDLMVPLRVQGDVVGVLGFQINPYPYFFPILRAWPAETSSAETVLAHRSDHAVVFVRQLRFASEAVAGPRLTPLQHRHGDLGSSGELFQAKDYRGVPVMAIAQPVSRTPWLLASKMDRAEFMAPLEELAAATIGTVALLLLSFSAVLFTWWRKERSRAQALWYEAALRRQLSAAHFDYLAKYANDIILLVDHEGRLIEANDRAVESYGYPREQLLGLTWEHLRAQQVMRRFESRWGSLRRQEALLYESWHRRADGTQFPVEISGRMIDVEGRVFFQAIIRDISERKEYQRRNLRLRDLYAALSQTNQAIIHCRDRDQLLGTICQVAVDYGHFNLAWVGLLEAETNTLHAIAHAGAQGDLFEQGPFRIDLGAEGVCYGPTATAVRERRVSVHNDLRSDRRLVAWMEELRRRRIASAAALPLFRDDEVVGALSVYAAEPDYFDDSLVRLLNEMGQDISYALGSLEQERRRYAAEQTLKESEARYRHLFDNMSSGVAVFEASAPGEPLIFKDVNRALTRIERRPRERLIGRALTEAFPEVVGTGLVELFDEVRGSGQPARRVITLVREGTPLGYRDNYVYCLPSGEVVSVYDDVTEQRQAEEALRRNEERVSLVLQATNDGFWDYNCATGYVYYSPRWLSLLGYEQDELESSPEGWARLVHPDDRREAWRRIEAHMAGRTDHYEHEHRMRSKSGEWRWILARGKVVRRDAEGHPLRMTGTHTDITERKRAEEQLRLWATVFENSGEAIFITDARRRIVSVNRAFTRITGYRQEEVQGKDPGLLRSGEHDEAFYQNMWAAIDESGYWQGEIWDRRKNGETYPQWLAISVAADAHGEVANYIAVFSDISEQKAAEERIRFLAHHDFLTGLPNRSALRDRLEVVMAHARRVNKQVAVLFVDLDRFKNINDSLGHHVGDELIKEVARRLVRCVRDEDTVCRLGGDEFILALSDVSGADDAAHIAGKVIEAVSRPYSLSGAEVRITPSVGISMFPADGRNIDKLIRNADAAMYLAKEKGRNNFQFFIPELNTRARDRLALENDLRRALEYGEFVLHYQPQINLRSGQVVGVEALLRWRKNDQIVSGPAEFIPVAEESGLIVPLGRWVLREACLQQARWAREGMPSIPVAVNISALQFSQKEFRRMIQGVLAETGINPRCLEIELTEGMLMADAEANIRVLDELKAMGVSVSIDDFGTGYSSLSYLRRFPIDRIKVDQSFVRDIETDATDRAITGAIIGLGKSLGLRVVAEGVETERELTLLREQQCEDVQGNYFSPPLEAEAFAPWLRRSGRLPASSAH